MHLLLDYELKIVPHNVFLQFVIDRFCKHKNWTKLCALTFKADKMSETYSHFIVIIIFLIFWS